ncbi:MAG: hypothetical protein JNK11_08525 [Alphaproteobacteria bacterium]|nr:hypothetical protein [Alphaproteobacteria bacterium]
MAATLKLRLYESNLLLAREMKKGEKLSMQLWSQYPYLDYAVRLVHDRHYKRSFMPSGFLAFGTDVLGFLPPGVAKVCAPKLKAFEEELEATFQPFGSCRFEEVDRWGTAIIEMSGSIVGECAAVIANEDKGEVDLLAPMADVR